MARKYDFVSELYNRTCKTVVANPESWEAFLRSACYNYRLRFDEQLLVHAQRPDATAVLQIDDWNQKFGRWVNRGAHGIAVFEDADQRRQPFVSASGECFRSSCRSSVSCPSERRSSSQISS